MQLKLHVIVASTVISFSVLEDTRSIYRFVKTRRARESGWTVVMETMDNTGRLPVCRGLVSETGRAARLEARRARRWRPASRSPTDERSFGDHCSPAYA